MLSHARHWLEEMGRGTLDLVFPPSCIACEAELTAIVDGIALCGACQEQIPWLEFSVCRRCAARVPEIPGSVDECDHCRGHRLGFDRSIALGPYEGLLRKLVLRMKGDRSERLAAMFAALMVERLGDVLQKAQPDVVVPVPMPFWRRHARGTNPAEALALSLGRRLGIRVCGQMLRRRNTLLQRGLSKHLRFRNVRGGVRLAAGYALDGPHVLLVDDVLTTGATCSETAKVLKRGGADKVTVVVVARTPSL